VVEDSLAGLLPTEHGIATNELAARSPRQQSREFEGGHVLVGLVIDANLAGTPRTRGVNAASR
jgi:hypothetical protein